MDRGAALHAARARHDARSPPPGLRHELAAARGVGGLPRRCRRAPAQAVRAGRVSAPRRSDPRPASRAARLGGEATASSLATRRRLAPAARRRRLARGPSAPRYLPPPDGRFGGAQQVRRGPPRGARRAARPRPATGIDRCGAPAGAPGFARRYGFRERPERIRFRMLDPALSPLPASPEDADGQDITLDVASFARSVPAFPASSSPRTRSTFSPFPARKRPW